MCADARRSGLRSASRALVQPAFGVDGQVVVSAVVQEPQTLALHQHGDRAHRAGRQRARCEHAHGTPVAHRDPAHRIEHMAIALPTVLEPALVVAAGGQPAAADRNAGHQRIGAPRIADANGPRPPVRAWAHDREVAAQIDVSMRHALRNEHGRGTVGGVLLAKSAEVELHAGLGEEDAGTVALHARPADERQQRLECSGIGRLRRAALRVRAEAPGAPQHAAGDVEQPAAGAEERVGIVEQGQGLRVAGHVCTAGRSVDARHHAVGTVTRVLVLDAQHLGDGCVRTAPRLGGAGSGQHHFAATAHRREADAPGSDPVDRWLRRVGDGHHGSASQNRRTTPNCQVRASNAARPVLPSPRQCQRPRWA